MNDIVLEASVVNVEPQAEVIVDAVSDAEAVVLDAVVRLENNEFVLSSGGMYGGGALIGSIPAWVLEAVNQRLTTGDGNLTGLVNDLQTALDALEAGVNQSISNLESDVLSQSGLITGLRSDVDENNATIMNVLATKVTEEQASTLALSAIQSTFGADVEAFVSNIASTYVDANSSIATEIDMMQASLNGVNASITDISSITIETVQNPLWVDDGNGTDPDVNGEPRWIDQAKAKKQLEVNADGVITGLLLESGQTSSITMQADEFKLVATGQSVASRNPFTVDATTGEITLNGKVSFNSVTDAPDMVAENTNINVSTNLVPNAGWNVGGHGDYQFVATPTYYRMIGAGTVAEDTLLLNVGDEVYTPYIADMTLSYKLSYSFKGAKIGSFITVVGTTPTSVAIIPSGVTVDPAKWYNVQIAVLPNGTTGGSLFGFIQESATLNIVSVISDVVLGATVEKFLMGFVATADTHISRVGIETITANTLSSVPVTAGNVNTVLASTNTVIDGGRITTGTVNANAINATTISASNMLVDQTVRSSDFTTIGGAGFRLKANAAGTSADPTIYGAYIKGGTIDGSLLTGQYIDVSSTKVVNPLNPASSGPFFISLAKYAANDSVVFVGINNGSGYASNRCVSTNQSFTIQCAANVTSSAGGTTFSGAITLYMSIDGVVTNLGSKSGGYYVIGGGGTFLMNVVNVSVYTPAANVISFYYTTSASNASISSSYIVATTQNLNA